MQMRRVNRAFVQHASPGLVNFVLFKLVYGNFLNFAWEHRVELTVSVCLSGGVRHSNKAGRISGGVR
jgi:hypothetical protein